MKITYVSHACLYVETSDAKILIDPWYEGPAYGNQWHVFPKPINTEALRQADFILCTHGHEDHLHGPTLQTLNKNAHVFYPYQWKDGIHQFIHALGFSKLTEATSFKTYNITAETKITFVSNNLDSIVVVENKGKVLVNLNDALNSHHKRFIRHFSMELKQHWPRVDYLFCGLGGAGYFPNCVHHERKNDLEVGRLREQFLAHNFCKLIDELKPSCVMPFVPGFALLADDKRWINTVKFPRETLPEYYSRHFDSSGYTTFVNLYPGDHLDNGKPGYISPYHAQLRNNDLSHLVETQYREEIAAYNTARSVPVEEVQPLYNLLAANLPFAARVFPQEVLNGLAFSVQIRDTELPYYLNIRYEDDGFVAVASAQLATASSLLITTTASSVELAMASEWGGDIFMVGYAADIHILHDRALSENLDIICLRLLTRIPVASDYVTRQPFRMARFMVTNPGATALAVKQKLLSGGNPNKIPYNERSHWINKTQCEICMACDLPLLSYSFGEQLDEEDRKQAAALN